VTFDRAETLKDSLLFGCATLSPILFALYAMASVFLERIRSNPVNEAQANWSEKKLVWVADKKEGYLQGSTINENGDLVEVLMEDQTVFHI
jgi:hypothetical protein